MQEKVYQKQFQQKFDKNGSKENEEKPKNNSERFRKAK